MRVLYPFSDVDLLDAYHLCGGRVVTYRNNTADWSISSADIEDICGEDSDDDVGDDDGLFGSGWSRSRDTEHRAARGFSVERADFVNRDRKDDGCGGVAGVGVRQRE